MIGTQWIEDILSVYICAVWINEHVITSLGDDGDVDIKECEEIYKGRVYADDVGHRATWR